MTMQRSMQHLMKRSIPLAAIALAAAAPFAHAQRRELFEWNGRVDREIQITMRGNDLATRDIGNTETGRARSRVMSEMPREDGQIVVERLNGRGSVDVIQQPSRQNGYTAVVRISDPSSGADDYRIAAYWQGYSNGDVYGRNNGQRDDGGYRNRDRNGVNDGQYNNQNVMHWSGNVDGEIELRIQNGRVDARTISGQQPTSVRADGANTSGMRSGMQVTVAQHEGRGTVRVVEQPSAGNRYTTVVRVRDPQGGYGHYDFDLVAR